MNVDCRYKSGAVCGGNKTKEDALNAPGRPEEEDNDDEEEEEEEDRTGSKDEGKTSWQTSPKVVRTTLTRHVILALVCIYSWKLNMSRRH